MFVKVNRRNTNIHGNNTHFRRKSVLESKFCGKVKKTHPWWDSNYVLYILHTCMHIYTYAYIRIHIHTHTRTHTYAFLFADPAIPPRSVEVLSANVSAHNGRLSTTGHPVLLSMNSMDNGLPPSYLQPTSPPSYGEYESYPTPIPLDETAEPPCIYTPSDDDNPMSEVRVDIILII